MAKTSGQEEGEGGIKNDSQPPSSGYEAERGARMH